MYLYFSDEDGTIHEENGGNKDVPQGASSSIQMGEHGVNIANALICI